MSKTFGRFRPARSLSILDGEGHVFPLAGGVEVSVVRHRGSYGGPSGLWEAATFDAAGTATDVDGWLTESDVVAYLERKGVQS